MTRDVNAFDVLVDRMGAGIQSKRAELDAVRALIAARKRQYCDRLAAGLGTSPDEVFGDGADDMCSQFLTRMEDNDFAGAMAVTHSGKVINAADHDEARRHPDFLDFAYHLGRVGIIPGQSVHPRRTPPALLFADTGTIHCRVWDRLTPVPLHDDDGTPKHILLGDDKENKGLSYVEPEPTLPGRLVYLALKAEGRLP